MNSVPLIAHTSFKENLVLAVPDFDKSGLKELGYDEIGSASLTQQQFQDHGSMHDYGLSGGLYIPLERTGFNRVTGEGELYLITQSWKISGRKTSESFAYAVNPEAGSLVYRGGKFILDKTEEEPIEVNRILGYGPYGTRIRRNLRKVGELSETKNLSHLCRTDPRLFWLEEWLVQRIIDEKRPISHIDFDPDEGKCLG